MGKEADVIKNICKSRSRSVGYNCRRNNKLNLLKCLPIVSNKNKYSYYIISCALFYTILWEFCSSNRCVNWTK